MDRQACPEASHPVLVLDIDDTALTNWEVIKADDFGRIINGPCTVLPEGPCGWAASDFSAKLPRLCRPLPCSDRHAL